MTDQPKLHRGTVKGMAYSGDQPTLQERLRNEWLAGFWAASLLFGGRYNDYAAKRDEMLAEKVEKNEQ